MIVKKTGSKIYGAELSASEKKAMDLEIRRQLADYTHNHELEMTSLILWQMHVQFGFGPERLRRFYDGFNEAVDALNGRYEFEDSGMVWLCRKTLKDYGVDIEKWNEERINK